jgi:hypothetical protein
MSERSSDTFRMPDSYYEPPDEPTCPMCAEYLDEGKCDCGYVVPDKYDIDPDTSDREG